MARSLLRHCTLFLATLLTCAAAVHAEPPKHIVFLISESEYDTKTTLPAFAKAELEPRGFTCTFCIAPEAHPDEFPGTDALKSADLVFISVRRQAPSEETMALLHAHLAAKKAIVGIRTASHAFAPPLSKNPPPARPGHAYWPEFDHEVLGGNYANHYGVGIPTIAKILPEAMNHPVLQGIAPGEFPVKSHLYKNPSLPASDTILMTGRMENRPEVEPIAWVNTAHGGRVFYTSLGSPGDFEIPQFPRLLLNGICWALNVLPEDNPPH